MLTLIATVGFMGLLIGAGVRFSGEPRAALLGLAAACGYALTAALMKEAVAALDQGVVAFFETWQLYGVAIAGVGSLMLLQNALQAGTLAASQPALTVGDALLSTVYGVMLFHETLRLGWWLIPEIVCLGLIVVGYIEIAKSPVAMAHDESERTPAQAADGASVGPHAGAAATPRPTRRTRPVTSRDLVVGEAGVQVHVVPAVLVQGLAAPRALVAEASLLRDPARGRVERGVVQLDPVQPDGLEHPLRHRPHRTGRDVAAAGGGHGPVGHLGPAFVQADGAEADPAHQHRLLGDGPARGGLGLPAARPRRQPVRGLTLGQRPDVPLLDVPVGVGGHHRARVGRLPGTHGQLVDPERGLGLVPDPAGRDRR